MAKVKLVQGDADQSLNLNISEFPSGQKVSLTGGSVAFKFRAVGTTNTLFTKSAQIGAGAGSGDCTVVLSSADMSNLVAGDYEAEVEVTQQSGARQTVFDPIEFRVREDFA